MFNWFLNGKKTATERREETLSAYIDGELSPREQADLERSLAKDPALRAELGALREVVGMMHEVPQVRVPRSFALDPAVYGRAKQPWLQLYPMLRAATVLATVFLVFLFAGDLFLGLGGGVGMPTETMTEQLAEVHEVEEVLRESDAAEVTLEVEAPAAKLAEEIAAEEAVPEEAAAPAAEPQSAADDVARVMGTEAAAGESIEATESPAAAIQAEGTAEEAPAEEPSEEPMLMAVPPTTTVEGEALVDNVIPESGSPPPAPEATAEALDQEAPEPALEMGAEVTDEQVPLRADEEGGRETNWLLIAEIGLGALAATLLLVTLLARRYGW